uniref:Retrotransposon gag domain-containing protein n=1 Tax=Tanacetum cinerariifolium TaxID=118510 RepID=A0A6L2LX27_TANCI|nr:hypothetical protein [Tanacetum cinerariifolium]
MDNPNITMEEYIRLEEENARKCGKVFNWKLLRMVRSAIVYNDAQTSKSDLLAEPTFCTQYIDEFNLKDETSLSECDEKEQHVLNFNDLFPFNVTYPNDSKSNKDNDDDKINIEKPSRDMSVIPLPDVINTDVCAYAQRSPEPHVKQSFIEEFFAVKSKIKILMEIFKTPPNSPPITVIDPDDHLMWSSTRTVSPTPSSAIIQLLIHNFHIKEARTWLNELNEGTINLWNELREAFISRYFSPTKFRRLLNDIHSFHQLDNKTLVDAWLRIKEMLRTCYGHGLTKGMIIEIFYRGLDDPTQGLRIHQAIIKNLEREFEYLEKNQQIKFIPHTTNTKLRHEIVYKPPSIQNENDKGDVKAIEEDEIKPIPTISNPNLINSNSLTVSPFFKDCTMHISYTNAKTFSDDVLLNHVGGKELNLIDGVGNGVLTKNEIKKDEMGMPKEPNKEWKLNDKYNNLKFSSMQYQPILL